MQLIEQVQQYIDHIPADGYGINVTKFNSLILSDSREDYYLLDIRDEQQFETVRIKDSMNIPFAEVGIRLNEIPLDKKIIVICNSGFMATQTTTLLNLIGYQAKVLLNGMNGYMRAGGDVERH